MARSVLDGGMSSVAESMPERLLGPDSQQNQPKLVAEIQQMIRRAPARSVADCQLAMASRQDAQSLLRQIDVPPLVTVGTDDGISTPHEMRGIAESIPNARFAEIESAGHLAPMEQPARFNLVLESFLSAGT